MARVVAWSAVIFILPWSMAQSLSAQTAPQLAPPPSIVDELFELSLVWRFSPYSGASDYNGDNVVDEKDIFLLLDRPVVPTPTSTPTPTPTPQTHTVLLPGNVPLEFILVQPGTFVMGANDPPFSAANEFPAHVVTINNPFYLAKYELTQKQWLAVMNTWPQFPPDAGTGIGDNKPAYYISWDDCHNLITALNALSKGTFRMPSEAEWEFACRAGSNTRYPFGDDTAQLTNYAWFNFNNTPSGVKDVGQKLPNAWGFYDMLGNADEYVEDDWHDSYRQTGSRPDDGSVWANVPRSASSVARGGFYLQNSLNLRSSYRRGFVKATSRGEIHNVRLVLDPSPTPTPTPTPPPGQETFTLMLPGDVPMEFIKVNTGSFVMGQDVAGQSPPHTVTFGYSFYLGKFELTQKQWLAVMGSWPGTPPAYVPRAGFGFGDNYPAYYINWDDCRNWVHAANQLGIGTFRLPSESEWEYACAAGATITYYYGNDVVQLVNYAWYDANNSPFGTKPVGGKLPNAWGFYDMMGNVYELCEDDYHDNYGFPNVMAPVDGSAWVDTPRGAKAMMRGGNYLQSSTSCQTHYRNSVIKSGDAARGSIGVRMALEAPP